VLVLPADGVMVVQDQATRRTAGAFQQLWHLVPGADVRTITRRGIVARHPSGEAAVIEIAITELHVRNVLVCGHTRCRALASLFAPSKLEGMPAAAAWLEYAQATQRIVCEKYAGEAPVAQMEAAAEENVLVQIANLRTHPAVAAAIASEQIQIQGLVHRVETDELAAFDATRGRFVSITANANEHTRASV